MPDDYKNFSTLRGHEHTISTVCFLPGDGQVVSSSRDRTVRVWDVQNRYSQVIITSIPNSDRPLYRSHCIKILKPHDDWIRSALPSPDGALLLTCADDHVSLSGFHFFRRR